ncbi:membrane protein [Microbacterium sp. CH12i]|uniref:hypothetical protein n=1 Tax=Microbacterium sp. CH12i TaxID=1479651 RepID=UPI000460C18B|nr:hypothetical protein [Microbacterium sp. CH12i]KDA06785.1 membrane protein [Microbacterium sp. CH12i]
MIVLALTSTLVLLAALTALQVLVALGLPLGHFVWGGQHKVLPTRLRIGSVVSVVLYVAIAAVLLSRAGVIPGGDSAFVLVATWVLFGYFALGILMNAISRSRLERFTMTPVTIALAAATLIIALTD